MTTGPCDKHEVTNCDYCKPKPPKLRGVWATRGVAVIESKYPGKCICGDYYGEGERIAKRDGEDGPWVHEDCL